MESNNPILDKISALSLSAACLIIGLGFILLGVTLLPIIGIFMGIPFLALSSYLWNERNYARKVAILVGYPPDGSSHYARFGGRGIIPVAILSTERNKGEPFDFDARTVEIKSVKLEPGMVKPVENKGSRANGRAHFQDVDGDGDTDVVFYFSLKESGFTEDLKDICLTGETVDGEIIRGCAAFVSRVGRLWDLSR